MAGRRPTGGGDATQRNSVLWAMLVCRIRGHGPVVVFPGSSQRVEEHVFVGDVERVCRRCGAILSGGVPQEGDWISREHVEQPINPYFDEDLN